MQKDKSSTMLFPVTPQSARVRLELKRRKSRPPSSLPEGRNQLQNHMPTELGSQLLLDQCETERSPL